MSFLYVYDIIQIIGMFETNAKEISRFRHALVKKKHDVWSTACVPTVDADNKSYRKG